jgi:hypothetical protein
MYSNKSIDRWKEQADERERRMLAVSVLFVLKEMDIATIREWWKSDIYSRILHFLALLRDCLDAFQVNLTIAGISLQFATHVRLSKKKL